MKKRAVFGPGPYLAGWLILDPGLKINCVELDWSSKFYQVPFIPPKVIQLFIEDRQTDRQTGRQIDRQTDRQTHTHTDTQTDRTQTPTLPAIYR